MPKSFGPIRLARRGVIVAPYLSEDGHPILISIDSNGRRVREVTLAPNRAAGAVTPKLKAELDRVDPQPAGA